jgi:hypothetical protein
MTTQSNNTELYSFDSQRWAAEEAALQLGWLRECPYHGEPFRTTGPRGPSTAGRHEPAAPPFDANSDVALLFTRLPLAYAEQCPLCARESAVPE